MNLPLLNIVAAVTPAYKLLTILALWLNLHAGLSREVTNTTLKALHFICQTLLQLIFGVLQAAGLAVQPPVSLFPKDIRTIYAQGWDPEINRTICCPKCFSLFPDDEGSNPVPDVCPWRKNPNRGPRCGTKLWKLRKTRNGLKRVPKRYYSTQNFQSWLSFFLGRPVIREGLAKSAAANRMRGGATQATENSTQIPAKRMKDVQDSPAWASLGNYTFSQFNMVWGMYIDWFNPFSNKQAGNAFKIIVVSTSHSQMTTGKVLSCGAIVLYCLSLPIELRFRFENIFIIGLIPGPGQPDVWTIAHILDHLVTVMNEYWNPGVQIYTPLDINGILVQVVILALIADLAAIRKVAGYKSYNANMFCSVCLLHIKDIESLGPFDLRNGRTVKEQGIEWKNLTTVTDKKKFSIRTGVRWTPTHDLIGWDPVKRLVLDFMHNILEGIAQDQLRDIWGIGRRDRYTKRLEARRTGRSESPPSDVIPSDSSASDSGSEQQPQNEGNAQPMDVDECDESGSTTPTPGNLADLTNTLQQDDEDDEDEDDAEDELLDIFNVSGEELSLIWDCIKNVELPTWVGRPPGNLGEAAHGKLKADELLTLFTAILPLVLPEIWLKHGEHGLKLLDNFYHLVACINIVASYATSEREADAYERHFIAYRKSLSELFPFFSPRPNFHFAMHNPENLKWFGPLAALSAFAGERFNGMLGKIKTNRRICKKNPLMFKYLLRLT